MNLTLPNRRLHKPRKITGIDWGHACARGLRVCIPYLEPAGRPMEHVLRRLPDIPGDIRKTVYGPAMPTAGSTNIFPSYGNVPRYDTASNFTCASLLYVRSWSSTTSGDFWFGKNTFQTRGWILLNNGAFGNEIGFRTDCAGASTYAVAHRSIVGSTLLGLMLFVGRRTGTTIEFITVRPDGLTVQASASEGGSVMVSPAGSNLEIGSTNANGSIDVLGNWLWDYPVPNRVLEDLFEEPWSMLQEDRARTRVVVYQPVSKTGSILVEAKGGVASTRSILVEAWQRLAITKTVLVEARGFLVRQASLLVESTSSVSQTGSILVEAKGGVSHAGSILVEAKGSIFFSTWPADLPLRPLLAGWKESMPKTGARTAIDKFPQTQHQRSKAGTWALNESIQVTSAQLDIFWTFYTDTLGYGALPFTCPHPLTQSLVRMRFRGGEVPSASAIGWNTYHIALPLEVLP